MRELKWSQYVFEPTETSFSAFARNKWQLFKTKKKENVFIAGQSNMSQLSSWFLSIFSFSWTEQISRIYKKLRSFYDFYFYSINNIIFLKSASALSPPPMTWQSHLADRTWGSKSRFGILPLVMILEAVAPIIPCAAWSLNHSRVLLRREGGMIGIVSA